MRDLQSWARDFQGGSPESDDDSPQNKSEEPKSQKVESAVSLLLPVSRQRDDSAKVYLSSGEAEDCQKPGPN